MLDQRIEDWYKMVVNQIAVFSIIFCPDISDGTGSLQLRLGTLHFAYEGANKSK